MKITLVTLAALAICAGSLKAGDWNYWRQQQWQNEENRRQAEWQARFDRGWDEMEQRRIQSEYEQRFQELEHRLNRDCDFEFDD
jgi:hypothetical protein